MTTPVDHRRDHDSVILAAVPPAKIQACIALREIGRGPSLAEVDKWTEPFPAAAVNEVGVQGPAEEPEPACSCQSEQGSDESVAGPPGWFWVYSAVHEGVLARIFLLTLSSCSYSIRNTWPPPSQAFVIYGFHFRSLVKRTRCVSSKDRQWRQSNLPTRYLLMSLLVGFS